MFVVGSSTDEQKETQDRQHSFRVWGGARDEEAEIHAW